MFSAFTRSIPQISIFHHPSSPPSVKALNLLRAAITGPYPPSKPDAPPLEFNLDIVESAPPTADQLRSILTYLPSASASPAPLSTFLSSHPSAPSGVEEPKTVDAVTKLASSNPSALKWPIVVDWYSGKASIGDVEGVKGILEELRMKRDGDVKEGEESKSKGWFS
ncbi:hypothetical protein OE88DRAFT_1738852 [Heliocybe sulcata]|uniref:Thioredoxin-like protein n=1 Tax=Heliocybe sulcata TaxID=5364 RepID=A0A5C3MPF3_9AGAM|nr:hypothetical protein OE88DRAFT_1738852 [Heliocybe sulcata]